MEHESYETPSLYTDPKLYDILHAPGTADDVDTLERIARDHAPGAPSHWLEPACGTGRYLRLAAKREPGRAVTGFDLEPAMIEYASARMSRAGTADAACFFVADMRCFADGVEPRSVGLAFNLINTIRHLETDGDVLMHLEETGRVLHPDGVYAIGLSVTTYGVEPPSEDVWEGARGTCHVSQSVQYLPPASPDGERAELVYSHLTVTTPTGDDYFPSQYRLRAYNRAQWEALIDRSCMRLVAVTDMDGRPTPPPEIGYAIWILAPR